MTNILVFIKNKDIKQKFFFILRIAISFAILYLIFLKINFKDFLLVFSKINVYYLMIAFLVYLIQFIISTIKWQKLVDFFKVKLNFRFYLKFNLIGLFYATIMPGGILLGDLIKGYKIFRVAEDRKIIINSILMDRITGFIGLLVSVIFMYFIIGSAQFPHYRIIMTVALILLMLIFCFLFFSKKIFFILSKVVKGRFSRLEGFSVKVSGAVNTYSDNIGLLFSAILVGALLYLINALLVYFVALAVGVDVSFTQLFVINCLATFAVIIAPITFFGLGIRESFFIYFLSFLGVGREPALILSLSLAMIYLSLSLVGGVLEAGDVFRKLKKNKLKSLNL